MCAYNYNYPTKGTRVIDSTVASNLERVSVATLCYQLRRHGITGTFLTGLAPLRPDVRLLGEARTLRYTAHRADVFDEIGGGMNAQKRVIDSIRPGEVLVIEARGQLGAGTIGDVLALRVQQRGGTGVVTDGATRDTPTLAGMTLPLYTGGAHGAVLGERHVPMDSDLPITCAGVLVLPGDVLVGDAEGVVVIPRALAAEVAADAVEQERQETFIAERVAEGASIDGLYPLGPDWRPRYDTWKEDHS
jgi:5-oxopent-3-ene-1,2,5-tricarboxylate decarboxylase / 2-hydroxyhepta-2,4-diene-1,7-dioate isomerase